MLTPSQRLKIILEAKKLTTFEIAKEFGVNRSTISQWLSDNSKFKKVHIYAVSSYLGIDKDIFLDESIDTKEKLLEYLKKHVNLVNNEGKKLISKFTDSWYLYFYSHIDNEIDEYKISIKSSEKIIISNKQESFLGKIESLQNHATIKAYNPNSIGSLIVIVFNTKRLKDTILNVSIIKKTNITFRYLLAFGILSKESLSKERVKFILGLKNENFLLNNKNKRDKIIKILNSKDENFYINLYDEYHIFETLIGKWHLYTKNSKSDMIIKIDKSHQVSYFRDGILASKGEIFIDTFYTTIKLKNQKGISSYFSFKSNTNSIKVCCFRSFLYMSETNVIGIALISKEPLNKEFLDEFFDDDYLINVDKYHHRLYELIDKGI